MYLVKRLAEFLKNSSQDDKKHFILEFETWTSGDINVDKAVQKSQEFQMYNIKHIADGRYGFVHSAILKNGIKDRWDFEKQDWIHGLVGNWEGKIDALFSIARDLACLRDTNLVHCDLHGGNILIGISAYIDLTLCCKSKDDLIFNSDNKNNNIFGEIVTSQRPFADQAHDTYLMIDVCNGVRPKVPDFMLNWIPEWYLDLMYRCWSDDPFKRPNAQELFELFRVIVCKLYRNTVDDNIMQQLKIADENQKNTSKSQKQELFELFSYSSKLHPQSCYIGRNIHTLHGLRNSLEDIKSGKSPDPNLLKSKSNKSTDSSASTYDIDLKNH
ncbi:hypothetical protein Glove_81g64 [Diversispora epigaea]|uniref:Protein kinase domain-containing protein n=1 Tax=Diversispora epigaea TaxID=1348612 RepID=A0A397JH38_9GLOM|nr:hypothetical protein Glove_81g64 [Diversispora epigaea]